ncbi:acyl carrier protein [Paenibacillus radicis (ex Gao et al. 2016)]|uniref:Carrier domain-containing protein n=1 Tax=Paenibacillus radicis (ex Gao et al. 2016) TaxID=1737354 RepID=A0A917H9J5_9BACL|nr:acyl carrier protein [Paenibacillus radicis (ex Gao et al. 2016)]GGG71954.1 hypothetical protein GCM10010918_29510 [Paenibacillus radicis (ex Gao et al. 2016)]
MEISRKMELLAEVLEVEAGEISVDTVLDEIDSWDSMAKLSLIVMMEEECSKPLAGETIRSFKTVQNILDYMG